jgi:hypothetical protein
MTLHLEGVRSAVISDASYRDLLELMKFRHFRRYYFELDYDWAKLEFLQTVYERVHQQVPDELRAFQDFLRELAESDGLD